MSPPPPYTLDDFSSRSQMECWVMQQLWGNALEIQWQIYGETDPLEKSSSGDDEPLSNSNSLESLRELYRKSIQGKEGRGGSICLKYQEYICCWHVHFWRRKKCRGTARSCQANRRTWNEKVARKLKRSSFLGAHCNTRWYEINFAGREDKWKPLKTVWPNG